MHLKTEVVIREIKSSEYTFLEEMLYQAIFVSDPNITLPRSIIKRPDLKVYIENFGRKGDLCLVAEKDKKLIGAIWLRLFTPQQKGYGFVNHITPELSMAVLKEYKGQGIGTLMLKTMLEALTNFTYAQVSLSVDKANFAYHMYKKFGFIEFSKSGKSIIMTKALKDPYIF